MIELGWRAWSLALLASLALHAALLVGLKPSKDGVQQVPAGTPVAVAGSLASILGAQTAEPAKAQDTPTEAVPVDVAEPVEPPQSVETVNPTAASQVQAVARAQAPNASTGQALTARSTSDLAPVAAAVASKPLEVTSLAPQTVQPVQVKPVEQQAPVAETQPKPDQKARQEKRREIEQEKERKVQAQRRARREKERQRKERIKKERIRKAAEQRRKRAEARRLEQAKKARQQKRTEARSRAQARAKSRSRAGTNRKGAAGSARGGQGGRSRASAGAVRSYGSRVRARILANRPSRSGSGRAVVSFGISTGGGLRYARLSRSSGNASLDRAALAAVRRSSPFPRPPSSASARQLRFSISFSFR